MNKINLQNARLAVTAGTPGQLVRGPLPQIAFSGRSNVGKSSLLNTLLGRKALARVSASPGKTITVNYYDVDGSLLLGDLPGYGYAKRSREEIRRWSALTDGFFTKNPSSDRLRAVVQLVDCRCGATEDDHMMLDYLRNADIPFLLCVTKTDKLSKSALSSALDTIAADCSVSRDTLIPFSSLSGAGREELWQKIFACIE